MAYTLAQWNAIIDQVNALVNECGGIPLDPKTSRPWKVTDVEAVHNKLIEVCDGNSFDPPTRWLQSMIDAIEAAIANGACCCEEEDREIGGANTFYPSGLLIFTLSSFPSIERRTIDWAAGITEETEAAGFDEIPLATGGSIQIPTGGPRWVGRGFRRWEAYVISTGDPLTTPTASGNVIDGYIWVGQSSSQTLARALETAIIAERQAQVALAVAQVGGNAGEIAAAQANLDAKEAELAAAQSASDADPRFEAYPYHVGNPAWEVFADGPDGFSTMLSTGQLTPDNEFIFPSLPDSPYSISTETAQVFLRLLCTE